MTSRLYDDADARLRRLEALIGRLDAQERRADAFFQFEAARQRFLFALAWRAQHAPSRQRLWGLAREVGGRFMAHYCVNREGRRFTWWSEAARAVTPIGWRWEIVCDRDAVLVMPAWLYYPRRWYRWARSWWWWRRYEARR